MKQIFRVILSLVPGSDLRRLLNSGAADRYSPKFVTPKDEIVIDGFPRTANTFFYYSIQLSFPKVKIAHHVHSWQQFLFARLYSTHSILLLRDPDDAVASAITKSGGSPALWYLEHLVMTLFSRRMATEIIYFHEATDPAVLNIKIDELSKKINVGRSEYCDQDVKGLMKARTNMKNKPSAPLNIEELPRMAIAIRRLAKAAYQKTSESSN